MSRRALSIVVALIGLAMILAWRLSAEGLAWWHLAGLALSIGLLGLIWFWPGIRQPTKPPS